MDRATFVRELAEALAANEIRQSISAKDPEQHGPPSTNIDADAQIQATYQHLCHGWDERKGEFSDLPPLLLPQTQEELGEEEESLLLRTDYNDGRAPQNLERGMELLRNALLDRTSPYALSVPLVRGIDRHLLALWQQQQLQKSTSLNNPTTNTLPASTREEDTRSATTDVPLQRHFSSSSSLLESYAILAWTVHVQIPWLCCRTLDCAQAAAYLGSYSDLDHHRDHEDHEHHNTTKPPGEVNDLEPALHWPPASEDMGTETIDKDNDNENDNNENDSLVEVWAAELDDSDYEYESDWKPPSDAVLTEWAPQFHNNGSLDPRQLSQCHRDTPTTWNDVARAVTALVQSYDDDTGLGMLSPPVWERIRGVDVQLPLVVALLVPSSSTVNCPLLQTRMVKDDNDNDNNNNNDNHWRRLGVHLLNQWQACVWHYCWENRTTSSSASTLLFLEDYMRLLRILLQSGPGTFGKSTGMTTTALTEPAVLVSLGSLSFLCSKVLQQSTTTTAATTTTKPYHYNSTMITTLQSTVLDSCTELAELLERATTSATTTSSPDDTTTTAIDLQWIYLSLLQILTLTSTTTTSPLLPVRTAQTLLQSGLWRQWLLTALQVKDEAAAVHAAVQLCVLDLTTASPALLGKYAWRVPGWIPYVRAGVVVDVVVDDEGHGDRDGSVGWLPRWGWNVIGEHLATNTTSTTSTTHQPGVVKWKSTATTKSTTATTIMPTPAQCRQAAESLWEDHCARTRQVLSEWKMRRNQPPESHCENLETTARQAAALGRDWQGCATRLPMLRRCNSDGGHAVGTTMREGLLSVQRLFAQWPLSSSSLSSNVDRKAKPDDDDDGDLNPESYAKGVVSSSALLEIQQQDDCVNGLRKAIKTILSVLEEQDEGGDGQPGSSQQQPHKSFSSKAD